MKKFLMLITALVSSLLTFAADLVTLPEGVVAEEYTLNITYAIASQDGFQNQTKEFTTKVAFDGNEVYLSGLAYFFPTSYVKGTLQDGKAIFPTGQFLGTDQYGNEYLTGYTLEGEKAVPKDFVFNYDSETRVFSLPAEGDIVIGETSEPNAGNLYCYVKSAVFTPGGLVRPTPVEVPENLKPVDYLLIGTYIVNEADENGDLQMVEEPYQLPISVGFDGDDLYVQGFIENIPESWAKATKDESGNYVLPVGQYIGSMVIYGNTFDYYLSGVNRLNRLEPLTFIYHPEDGSITSTQTMVINGNNKTLEAYYWIKDIKMKKIAEKEATPATPQFTFHAEKSPYGSTTWYYANIFLPLVDTNDDPLSADKLSYMFYYKKDGQELPVTFPKSKYYMLESDLTEIPFGFTDKLDIGLHTIYFEKLGITEIQSWTALGLQTIYRGNGVEHRSEIFWFDLSQFWKSTGIQTVISQSYEAPVIYNLSGQRLKTTHKGLNIINGKKVFVK